MRRFRCEWRKAVVVLVAMVCATHSASAWDEFEDDAVLRGGRGRLVSSEISDGGRSLDLAIAGGGELMDAVLAVVDGEPLTMGDLRQFIASHGEDAPKDILADRVGLKNAVKEKLLQEIFMKCQG